MENSASDPAVSFSLEKRPLAKVTVGLGYATLTAGAFVLFASPEGLDSVTVMINLPALVAGMGALFLLTRRVPEQ
jgi:hypothetical protein